MLKSLFSPDNPVIRFMIKLGYIWWLNILWLLSSLPIITIGASSTALIYSCMKLHQDEGYPTANFFKSFRENFRQSTILWCIYLVVGAILGADIIFWNHQGKENRFVWGIMIAVGILYMISLSYVFAIQSKFNNPIRKTIMYSVILPFHNMKETVLILITVMAVVFFNVTSIFMVNFFTLNLGVGLIAYLLAVFYINVFERYVPARKAE